MSPEIKKRLARTALFAAIAFLVGGSLALIQIKSETAATSAQKSTNITMPGMALGGPFELVDHNGATVTQADYAAQYKLIYFGFTYCPAICPTELQKLSAVMNALGDAGKQIQPLFITIDPERDTPNVMRDYVGLFHPRLTGLSGSRTQIDQIVTAYRVYAAKVQEPDMQDYTMDHSSYIYLMSPNDKLLAMYRMQDDADYVARDVKTRLQR